MLRKLKETLVLKSEKIGNLSKEMKTVKRAK
jgi:hypothetical protein